MMFSPSPGPAISGQSPWSQGDSFLKGGPPPRGAPAIPDAAQPAPASSASQVQPADAPSAQSPALSSTPARPIAAVPGPPPPRSAKPAASEDTGINVAAGAEPGATSPPALVTGDDQMGSTPAGGPSGSAQSIFVSVGLASYTMLFTPTWGIPSGPLRQAPEIAARPAAAGEIERLNRSAVVATSELPAPRGAGLITDLAAFRQGPIEESLTRLFGGLGRPLEHAAQSYPYLFQLALAVVSLEVARRWRRRSTPGPQRSRRSRHFLMNSL